MRAATIQALSAAQFVKQGDQHFDDVRIGLDVEAQLAVELLQFGLYDIDFVSDVRYRTDGFKTEPAFQGRAHGVDAFVDIVCRRDQIESFPCVENALCS